MGTETTVYAELRAAGCNLDSHESDLYVEDTATAREIIARYPDQTFTRFRSQIEPRVWWLDLPFRFDPWWEKRRR